MICGVKIVAINNQASKWQNKVNIISKLDKGEQRMNIMLFVYLVRSKLTYVEISTLKSNINEFLTKRCKKLVFNDNT